MKICIDAGHGGRDPGAVGVNGRRESADTLRMALELQTIMTRRGHSVIMTRTDDSYPSITSRYQLANASGADVFVSLHRNAAGETANGVETLYRSVGSKKTSADDAVSKRMAGEINDRICEVTEFRDRGAKSQNERTAVLQYTTMPAVTVEAGFVTNAGDNAEFDGSFDLIMDAIADGIEVAMGIQPVIPEPVPDAYKNLPYSFVPCSKRGDIGERVRWVQQRLMRHNALPGGQIDGIFGSNTDLGVRLFQAARLAESRDIGASAPDGKVGPKTATILAE